MSLKKELEGNVYRGIALSKSQVLAVEKLSKDEYKTAYDVGCSLSTLNALVKKGLADKKTDNIGYMFSPRISNHYKLI